MKILVVGAGVSGLSMASELARRGCAVDVVEREAIAGGLARSFRYPEGFFDVGPHRIHTDDPIVQAWLRAVFPGELLRIPRRSAVHAFGALHEWPLRSKVLFALPPGVLVRALADLLRRRGPGSAAETSFEAEMRGRYGGTLYERFFEPYTRRFLDLDPALIHRDWGRAGIDRALIDRRVRASRLGDLVRTLLVPRSSKTTFLYPRTGIGSVAEHLAAAIERRGGRVLLGREVTGVEVSGDRVRAVVVGDQRLEVEGLVWTAPLTTMSRMVGAGDFGLRFRATVLYNLSLRTRARLDHQWVYFGEEPAFVRVSLPTSFSSDASRPGRGAVCVERTCGEGDETWARPERHLDEIVRALVNNRVVARSADVDEVHVERVADTYPIYTMGYREARAACLAALRPYRNLLLAGRCGRFWYNNMDHSIAQGLHLAAQVADGKDLADVDVGPLEYWGDQGAGGTGIVETGR